jgi:hypothetical protein
MGEARRAMSSPRPSVALLYTDFTRVGHGGFIFFA